MKAIIVKELRENLKWALLLLFGLLIAVMVWTFGATGIYEAPLVGRQMHVITSLGFPAVGLALGMLQILQDASMGRWAFLTHRPISRTQILLGKVTAGMILYIAVTGLTLLAAAVWAATPGRLGMPFDWHMLLPRISDEIDGTAWYAAGLLVATRRARWLRTRLFPAGFAILVSIFAVTSNTFLQATLFHLAGICILLIAAWGAFIKNGDFEPQALFARFLQGGAVCVGMILLGITSIVITAEAIYSLIGIEMGFVRTPQISQSYQILKDGQIVILHQGPSGESITDLQGNRVALSNIPGLYSSTFNSLLDTTYLGIPGPGQSPPRLTRLRGTLQDSNTYAQFLGNDGSTNWYYDAGRRTVEGYNSWKTKQFIGSIGPNGFEPAPERPQSFPGEMTLADLMWPYLGTFGQGTGSTGILIGYSSVYAVNIASHYSHLIFSTGQNDSIVDAGAINADHAPTGFMPRTFSGDYVVATRSSIHVIRGDHELFSLPFPSGMSQTFGVEIGRDTSGRFIFDYFNNIATASSNPSQMVIAVDEHGSQLSRTDLPPLAELENPEPWWQYRWQILIGPPMILSRELGLRGVDITNSDPLGISGMIAVGLIAAGLCRLLLPRYVSRRSAKNTWLVLSFLLGFPGILLLISLRQRVAVARCPSCRKHRIVTREFCEHCGAAFEKPSNPEIEIFEMA